MQIPANVKSYPALPKPAPLPTSDPNPEKPMVILGAQSVKPLPITQFGGDILIGASQDISIDTTAVLGDRCTGFLAINATGTVQISVNNGPLRTVTNDVNFNDCYVSSIRIKTAALSSLILQLHGV
jgi:hypothetical protein